MIGYAGEEIRTVKAGKSSVVRRKRVEKIWRGGASSRVGKAVSGFGEAVMRFDMD